ncbi:hypothetical protein ACWDTT_34155 [Streptosporangium sandarakinum]|uniref:hypothetical protein n=1 Tax=Streptosporangium TaxID=2000 RepID=UPI0031F9FD8E
MDIAAGKAKITKEQRKNREARLQVPEEYNRDSRLQKAGSQDAAKEQLRQARGALRDFAI